MQWQLDILKLNVHMQMACWRRYNSELPHSENEKEDAYLGKESGTLSCLSQKVWSHFCIVIQYNEFMKNTKGKRRGQMWGQEKIG